MEDKTRNRKYLKNYLNILKTRMNENLNGQSILYIVKDILNADGPMEKCSGFETLDAYLKQQQEIEKMEYIKQHMDVLDMNLADILDGATVLYAIKEILVSNRSLKQCQGYKSLNQYIEKTEWLQKQISESNQSQELQRNQSCQEELILLHILSSVVSVASKGPTMDQVSQIPLLYQYVGQSQDAKGYQKQMASIA